MSIISWQVWSQSEELESRSPHIKALQHATTSVLPDKSFPSIFVSESTLGSILILCLLLTIATPHVLVSIVFRLSIAMMFASSFPSFQPPMLVTFIRPIWRFGNSLDTQTDPTSSTCQHPHSPEAAQAAFQASPICSFTILQSQPGSTYYTFHSLYL